MLNYQRVSQFINIRRWHRLRPASCLWSKLLFFSFCPVESVYVKSCIKLLAASISTCCICCAVAAKLRNVYLLDMYPLVNRPKKLWKDPPFSMGKSTISTGSCSIAMLVITRGSVWCMAQDRCSSQDWSIDADCSFLLVKEMALGFLCIDQNEMCMTEKMLSICRPIAKECSSVVLQL